MCCRDAEACFLGFLGMLAIWSFILWNILLCAKVDGAIDWAWYYIFIPLWASLPGYFVLIGVIFYDFRTSRAKWFGAMIWLWLCGIGVIIWTVLLAIKLENPQGFIAWYWVFLPLWVSSTGLFLIDEDWPEYKHEFYYPMWRGRWNYSYTSRHETFRAFGRILPVHTLTCIIIFTVLLVLELEGVYTTSWGVKFIPFWWLIGLVWLIVFTGIILNPSQYDHMIIYPILSVSIPMVFLLLLGLYLAGIIETYLAVVWIPIWIVEAVALFAAMSLCCILGSC